MISSPYIPIPAELVEVVDETPTIKTLVLRPAEPLKFRAGQFVQLTLPGVAEAPFTPYNSPLEPDRTAITIPYITSAIYCLYKLNPCVI